MRLGTVTQQPCERKVYSVVYSTALDTGDTLSEVVSCLADPDDLQVAALVVGPDRVRLLAHCGTAGTTYNVGIIVDTVAGERLKDTLVVRVKDA